MGGKSAPAAPDYRGAAEQQGASSREATTAQNWANRPTQNTPWGQSSWESSAGVDPATGQRVTQWEQNITLDPAQQAALDSQMAVGQGRSELAEGLIGRAGEELGTPMDWSGMPPPASAPDVPDFYGQNLPQMGSLPNTQGGGQQTANQTLPGYDQMTGYGNVPQAGDGSGLPAAGQGPQVGDPNALPAAGQGAAQEQYNPENIQQGLDFSGQQELNAGGGYNPDFAQTQFDRQMSLQGPQMEKQMEQMDTRLRNQGLSPGSEAYDSAMQNMRNQQGEQTSRMSQDAMRLGANEQQNQFGRELQARQQGVGEVGQQGNFANQAAQQGLNQQLGIGGQRFDQGMQSGQFQNQLRQQGQSEQQQQFNQQLGAGQYADQQRQNAQGEQQQQFNQQMSAGQFGNQQRAQQFGELESIQGMQGGAAEAQFQREMDVSNQQDRQRQQLVGEQLAMGGQGFSQQMQQANYQNSLRQQSIAEEAQRRGMSINEMNALMTGQQVSMPSMPNFQGAQRAESTQYNQAAQNAGNFAQQGYGTAMGPVNALAGSFRLGMP